MADRSLIAWSLETVAERHGDPTPQVYEKLFAQNPEMEALFILDQENSARGNMLANVFEVLLDLAGPRTYGGNMVLAEIVNHENLGVPPKVFVSSRSLTDTGREPVPELGSPIADEAKP